MDTLLEARFEGVELAGIFLLSFGRACINLHLLTGGELAIPLSGVQPDGWVPAEKFTTTLRHIARRFPSFDPILERIGAEMMQLWYEVGPGRSVVRTAVDFLHYQTGSAGYHSVVRGPAEQVGDFRLLALDRAKGHAIVRSTSPFDRAMERGVLIGGLQGAGDAVFVDVANAEDANTFQITFH